jgi:predicted GTPase
MGKKGVAIRHPMPYGDLTNQIVQRFSSYGDFEKNNCTIEEREEYEPLVAQGTVVYAGIDYEKILKKAEKEADIIIWDGGNNDTPFYFPDVHIVIFDPHRAGHETLYYPGETNMLMADIAVINKVDSAATDKVNLVRKNIETYAPNADIVLAESAVLVEDAGQIRGKRVLVVEDGPTLTHGGMPFGAGTLAAKRNKAARIIDPRPYITGTINETFKTYPKIGAVLPAMGYGKQQMQDLERTINNADCDLVLFATPIDLPKLLSINKPMLRVRYEYKDHGSPTLKKVLSRHLKKLIK